MSYDNLEPGSAKWSNNTPGAEVQYSQAVSLKRIADALEKLVPPVVSSIFDDVAVAFPDIDKAARAWKPPVSTHKVSSTVVTSQDAPVQPVPAGVASTPPEDEEDET